MRKEKRNIASRKEALTNIHLIIYMAQRILVVDDEPDLREILQCNLENAGYEVDTAESAEEALHKLSPEHDLILLDVMLGGMSGFRMANKLRNELKLHTPIISSRQKILKMICSRGFRREAMITFLSRSRSTKCWHASKRCYVAPRKLLSAQNSERAIC